MGKIKLDFHGGLNNNYIQLSSDLWGVSFFPDYSWHFVVSTDDDKVFFCSREKLAGKGVYSVQPQSSLGEYFHCRLDVPFGLPITENDLRRYGRTSLDFYKIDDETYHMDFSV